MTLTLSPPIKIAALVGIAAALGLGAMLMLMGHGSSSSSATAPVHIVHHPFGPGVKKAAATAKTVATKASPAAKTAKKLRHVAVPRHAAERSAAEAGALNAGLPARLARALGQHDVVVVELTNPQAEVDGIAYAEARAGAAEAGVGFVALSVLSQADVGKLTEQFGQVLPDPGLLVYTRPARLAIRIDGFADKDTVAQAAHNALTGS